MITPIRCLLPRSLNLEKASRWRLKFNGKKINIEYDFRDRYIRKLCQETVRVYFELDSIDFACRIARTDDYIFDLDMKKMDANVPRIMKNMSKEINSTMIMGAPPKLKLIYRIRQLLI